MKIDFSSEGSTPIGSGAGTDALVRASKYLNNLIEQDHLRVKQRVYPILGFKRFENAEITIIGGVASRRTLASYIGSIISTTM